MKPRIFCGILPLSSSDPLPRRRVILPSFPDDQTSPPHIHSFLWKSVPATIFLLLELLPTPPYSLPADPPGKPKNTGESQGRGSLVGHHLRGRTESDTTEET